MKSVVTSGTGRSANIPGLNVAGKTGTTNFPAEIKEKYNIKPGGVGDIWFAGYTPHYTAAVWTGYEKTSETNYILSPNEKALAKEIFKTVIQKVSEGKEPADFEKPKSVVLVGVEKGSNPAKLPSEFTPKDQIVNEYFIKGTEPKEVSDAYKKIDSPTDLSINYDNEKNEIKLNWKYPEEFREGISFEVQYSVDEGPFEILKTVKELGLIVQNPIPEAIYTFRVIAYREGDPENRSDPVDVTITIPAKIEDEIDIIPGDEDGEGEEPPPEGNGNGNGQGQGDKKNKEDDEGIPILDGLPN
jgi:penicillin-binding protein 1A